MLKDILKKTKKAKIGSPALTVIGEVVTLRKKLAWFEKKPLKGKTILITRARSQASELARKLKEKGAHVVEFPTIEIFPPSKPERIDREIQRISQYDWAVFTSANGVNYFFERMERLGKDARIFSKVKVATIGDKTAEALMARGIRPDLIPNEFTTHDIFKSLKKTAKIRGEKFLLARADIAPPDLREALEREGAEVTELETYRTRPVLGEKNKLLGWFKKEKIDYVTFTSSSTVKNFFDPIPPSLRKGIRTDFISIGPVTSDTLRKYGFEPAQEAKVHTIEGLVEALAYNGGKRA